MIGEDVPKEEALQVVAIGNPKEDELQTTKEEASRIKEKSRSSFSCQRI